MSVSGQKVQASVNRLFDWSLLKISIGFPITPLGNNRVIGLQHRDTPLSFDGIHHGDLLVVYPK